MITLEVIGYVRVKYYDEYVKEHSGQIEGVVEVLPRFAEGLDGIEDYSHLLLISYLHKQLETKSVLKVRPKRLLKMGLKLEELPLMGVFATDSPTRPNPIGLTLVRLIKREDNLLYVWGLDLFNDTPILDIKPYSGSYVSEKYSVPDWVKKFDA